MTGCSALLDYPACSRMTNARDLLTVVMVALQNYVVLAYPEQVKHPEKGARHQEFRDGHAAMFLTELLKPMSCRGIFFNEPYPESVSMEEQRLDIMANLKGTPLLVLSTRPPMHDPTRSSISRRIGGAPGGPKKIVRRSGNWLEQEVFKRLTAVFSKCARDEIVFDKSLSSTGAQSLSFGRGDDASVDGDSKWTPCFLIYVRKLWAGGPDLFCSFGIVWTYDLGVVLSARHSC